jgi:hypothetical protein
MKKIDAYRSFVYWGNSIITPTGRIDKRAEDMREYWAKAYDSGYYKKLPSDAIEADEMVRKKYSKR